MVDENAATGARLDGELERARGECATLRGELRDVRGALVLNNSSNNNSGASLNPTQDGEVQVQEDLKRLSAGNSPVDKRSSASDKSASPIEKRASPIEKKERTSPIDRRTSPIGETSDPKRNFKSRFYV